MDDLTFILLHILIPGIIGWNSEGKTSSLGKDILLALCILIPYLLILTFLGL